MPNMIFRKGNRSSKVPRPDALEWRVPLDDENRFCFHIGFL